jgi:hypothetical protein
MKLKVLGRLALFAIEKLRHPPESAHSYVALKAKRTCL